MRISSKEVINGETHLKRT